MDRATPTVSDIVTRAVELTDPEDVDERLGVLQRQFEDDVRPVTAVENLEERLASALEGTDYEIDDPAVSVAGAIVLYLAAHPAEVEDRDADGVIRRAVRAQWRGDPPSSVTQWIGE